MSIYDKYKSQILAKQKAYRNFAKPKRKAIESHVFNIKDGMAQLTGYQAKTFGVSELAVPSPLTKQTVDVFDYQYDIEGGAYFNKPKVKVGTTEQYLPSKDPINISNIIGTPNITKSWVYPDENSAVGHYASEYSMVSLPLTTKEGTKFTNADTWWRSDEQAKYAVSVSEVRDNQPIFKSLGGDINELGGQVIAANIYIPKEFIDFKPFGQVQVQQANFESEHMWDSNTVMKDAYVPTLSDEYFKMSNKDFVEKFYPEITIDYTYKKQKGFFASKLGGIGNIIDATIEMMSAEPIQLFLIIVGGAELYKAFEKLAAAELMAEAVKEVATEAAKDVVNMAAVNAGVVAAEEAVALALKEVVLGSISLTGSVAAFAVTLSTPEIETVDVSTNMPTVDTRIAMNPFVNGVYTTPYDYSATYDYSNMYDYNSWYNYG